MSDESGPQQILVLLGDEGATCSDLPMLVDIFSMRLVQTGEVFIVKWKLDQKFYIGRPGDWRPLSYHIAERLIKYYGIVLDREERAFAWYRPTTAKDCYERLSRRLDTVGKEFALLT